MFTAVSAISCCENPKLPVVVGAFFRSFAMMLTFGGAVETKVMGSRPPNGSGYDGLGMLRNTTGHVIWNCRAPVSFRKSKFGSLGLKYWSTLNVHVPSGFGAASSC